MARALVTAVTVQAKATLNSATGAATYIAGNTATRYNWASGTGADQADQIYEATRTINASSNEELDLAGVLVNELGETVTFATVKLLRIVNASADATCILTIGGAASAAWEPWAGAAGDTIKVRAGGELLLIAPDATAYAVGAGTTDKLKIANASGSAQATYTITIVGVKA